MQPLLYLLIGFHQFITLAQKFKLMTRKIINDKTMKTPRKTEQECIDKFCTYLQSKKTLRMDIEQKLLSLVVNARPNSESSLFPDFLFDGGFIEHKQDETV